MSDVGELTKVSPRPISADREGISAVFCVRNEKFRMPYFLQYYRELGVKEFFAVDNNSTDDTQAYLLSQPDVHVFHTAASYKESNAGRKWTSALADEFCRDQWLLTLDVDEFLVYPYIEEVDLNILTAYLDRWKFQGLFSIFLDFYAQGPLSSAEYVEGSNPFELCKFFDSAQSYTAFETENFPYMQIKGGVRQRRFWNPAEKRSGPSMRKIVLVKWINGFEYLHSTHSCSPIRLADITGALAHFKFLSHLKDFARSEVQRNDRVENSADWKVYADQLNSEDMVLYEPECSVKYLSSQTLLQDGQMKTSVRYFDYCQRLLDERNSKAQTEFLQNRREKRDQLKLELQTEHNISYADATKVWGLLSLFNVSFGANQRYAKSLFRIEARLEEVTNSRLWRATYYLRVLGARLGISDKRSITEKHFDEQDLYWKIRSVYESIWWDLLAFARLPIKLIRKIVRKFS